jgi:hypothetical protein
LVVLNFCDMVRALSQEMPHPSGIAGRTGERGFEVVTVATGTNQRPVLNGFGRNRVENLPLHTDNSALARDMGGRWPACDDYS